MKSVFLEKEEDGKKISPVLPEHVKNFLVDIDGTVGEDIPNEEPERMKDAEVYPDALAKVNQWFDEGHIITFFTSKPFSLISGRVMSATKALKFLLFNLSKIFSGLFILDLREE